MDKIRMVKYLGFLGAVIAACMSAISGDYVTAAGVIAAALSSPSAVSASQGP